MEQMDVPKMTLAVWNLEGKFYEIKVGKTEDGREVLFICETSGGQIG